MSVSAPPPPRPWNPMRPISARSLAVLDGCFHRLCQAAACSILLLAGLLVLILLDRSWLAIRTVGVGFLTQKDWDPNANPPVFGALAFVWGTVATSVIAMLIALPLGVGTAAYLSEIATVRLRRVASFFIEMLAAIPSVIYGFWGIFVLAPLVQRSFNFLGGPDGLFPFLHAPNSGGRGLLSAGLVLSVMIVPYIAAISYDVCQAVPRSQREGSLALGATRWQTIWRVVLPYARPGIVAGAFLALGRALGETMAVTMLIGNIDKIEFSLFARGDSIASRIANQYMEADKDLFRSVLVELGLLLLLVTLTMNTLARLLLYRVGSNKPIWPFSWRRQTSQGSDAASTDQVRGVAVPANEIGSGTEKGDRPGKRLLTAALVDKLMTGVLGSCVAFTMGMLVVILTYLLAHGLGALNWSFFTELPPSPTEAAGGGLANAIVGTIKIVGWATLLAVPIGLLSAIYLSEYRPGRLAYTVRFITEQLGGVPSIVIGIFAAGLFAIASDFCYRRFNTRLRFYGWSGVFALAVLMVPIVMRAAEEALKLVPQSLRNAAFALGSSNAQTILKVTVPAALPAIITAIFLSIARIAGETAPLLLTAGKNTYWPRSLNDFTPTLPVYIFQFATSSSENWKQLAWAGAFLLMVLVLGVNLGIRLITGKRVVQASRAD